MNNIFNTTYDRNGSSVTTNALGMREMQQRIYEKYASQYLLLKAPPASGKSRALMFVAIEKLKQGLVKKVIVAVPERSIGKSFCSTKLKANGFHSDWVISQKYDLCAPGGEPMKTKAFAAFMEDENASVLLCTHSTLRFAYEKIGCQKFNDCLLAIDEFHHVSAEADSKLGELIRAIMADTNAHVLAMTGSYFRGDCVAVLSPSDERKFEKVTYNYYEQLNGYQYLKSLGIGFHFYNGVYFEALKDSEVLDLSKKTIIYIPNVNSSESTGEKIMEVDQILGCIGTYQYTDDFGVYHICSSDGRELRVADLVNDTDYEQREKIMSYLRAIKKPEDMDIIIALGMAKEGFDWPFCETTLTIGYRGSLTEIVQIIGRCTRDSKNKTHAQFTNLVAEPSANREEIVESVNNILKAISASLLMEEVIAPKYNFKPKETSTSTEGETDGASKNDDGSGHTIFIEGFRGIKSDRVKDIIENDLLDLKARILQNPDVQHAIGQNVPAETINNGLIPKVIREVLPDLNEEESKELGTYIVIDSVLSHKDVKDINGQKFLEFANRLINVNDINIDLIYSVNPFHDAYEVLSKSLDARVFRSIQAYIKSMRIDVTDDEAKAFWPKVTEFAKKMQREPNLDSNDPYERRLAEVLLYAKRRIMESHG
ncbi:DEAD/DEAH box helicase [Porphyromonas levii]|uniref:DEAD/DEAH box helicase n=1 Tax=Porphyromonas levii TaxID=28114 RepID=UPI0003620A84|nr:DEAD/DEAH box helicase [Porphyromonas levii]